MSSNSPQDVAKETVIDDAVWQNNAIKTDTDESPSPVPTLNLRLICEFIGTCLFVLFGAGCAAKSDNVLTISAAHGIATIWLIYVFGSISGGHFNAGTTLAFAINRKIRATEAFCYLIAQAVGTLFAGILLFLFYGSKSSLGTPALSMDVSIMNGFAIEFVCTIVLSFVILFTTTYNSHKEAAFPIGLAIFSSYLLGADRNGAAFNPWRWLGPAVISQRFQPYAWIYVIGPIAGFLVGAQLFRMYDRLSDKENSQSDG
jgi:aquaporin NIP